MKNITRILKPVTCLVMILVLLVAQLPAQAAVSGSTTMATKGSKYVVTASYLNFRSGPGTNYSVITGLSRGTKVTYVGYKSGWWQVRTSSGKLGYVDRKYLTPESVSKTGKYFVTASNLRIRKSPTTSSGTLGLISKGTMVNISQLNGDWGYVSSGASARGWVALKYLSTSSVSSSNSSTTTPSATHYVTASVLNVRKSGSSRAERIDALSYGSSVKVVNTSGNWGQISYTKSGKTRTGWVSLDYVRAK